MLGLPEQLRAPYDYFKLRHQGNAHRVACQHCVTAVMLGEISNAKIFSAFAHQLLLERDPQAMETEKLACHGAQLAADRLGLEVIE